MFSSHLDIFQNNAIVQKVFVNGSKRKRAMSTVTDCLYSWQNGINTLGLSKFTLKNITTSVGFNTFGNEQFKYSKM